MRHNCYCGGTNSTALRYVAVCCDLLLFDAPCEIIKMFVNLDQVPGGWDGFRSQNVYPP